MTGLCSLHKINNAKIKDIIKQKDEHSLKIKICAIK